MTDICLPVHLAAMHDLEDFQSGEVTLDVWLRERARDNMKIASSRTYTP